MHIYLNLALWGRNNGRAPRNFILSHDIISCLEDTRFLLAGFFIVMWADSTPSPEDVNEVGRSHQD